MEFAIQLRDDIMADAISYLREFGINFGRDDASNEAEMEFIRKINQLDVLVFSKTGSMI